MIEGWRCEEIEYYAHCPDVFEDMKPFTTTRWNIILKKSWTFLSLKQVFYVVVYLSMFDNSISICVEMQNLPRYWHILFLSMTYL